MCCKISVYNFCIFWSVLKETQNKVSRQIWPRENISLLIEGFPIQTNFSDSHEDKFTFLLVHFFFQEPIHILQLSLRLKILALTLTSVVDDKTIYEIMWDLEGSHIMSWNLDEKSENRETICWNFENLCKACRLKYKVTVQSESEIETICCNDVDCLLWSAVIKGRLYSMIMVDSGQVLLPRRHTDIFISNKIPQRENLENITVWKKGSD